MIFIELKTGFDGDFHASILRAKQSKTRNSIHWTGHLLQQATADEREQHGWTEGNRFEVESRRACWASGVKREALIVSHPTRAPRRGSG